MRLKFNFRSLLFHLAGLFYFWWKSTRLDCTRACVRVCTCVNVYMHARVLYSYIMLCFCKWLLLNISRCKHNCTKIALPWRRQIEHMNVGSQYITPCLMILWDKIVRELLPAFKTISLQVSLLFAALWESARSCPVHSFMLSSQLCCVPRLLSHCPLQGQKVVMRGRTTPICASWLL